MACLLITEKDGADRCFSLGGHRIVSIGRDDQCTIQVLDPAVSRKHLQVRHDDPTDVHFAADHRSANGVYVNDVRIIRDARLTDGDMIRIGGTELVYFTADHENAEEARGAVRKKREWKRSTLIRPG